MRYIIVYDIREPIEVRVEKEMIEILSFPGPDRSVTQEGLKRFRVTNRRYRNRRIGDILKELHLTEGRNTGFGKILRALSANGSPKPEFETDDDHSYFISRFFVHEAFLKDENERSLSEGKEKELKDLEKEPKRSQKGAEKEPKKSRNKTENTRNINFKFQNNTNGTHGKIRYFKKKVQKLMKELQEENLLSREGTNRNGKWIIINK